MHACFPRTPPFSSQYGVFVHRSHFKAMRRSKSYTMREGSYLQAFMHSLQPMHFCSSIARTPVSGSTTKASVGQAATQGASAHCLHTYCSMSSSGYVPNTCFLICIRACVRSTLPSWAKVQAIMQLMQPEHFLVSISR